MRGISIVEEYDSFPLYVLEKIIHFTKKIRFSMSCKVCKHTMVFKIDMSNYGAYLCKKIELLKTNISNYIKTFSTCNISENMIYLLQ